MHLLVCRQCGQEFETKKGRSQFCSAVCAYAARVRPVLDRIVDMLVVTPNGCWEWQGARQGGGYGGITIDHRLRPVHVVIYRLLVGEVPVGLDLDHLCRNRICANPTHVEPVTRRENILRGVSSAAVHARQTECVHGHPFDEANTYFRKDGRRNCRTCTRLARRAAYRPRRRAA